LKSFIGIDIIAAHPIRPTEGLTMLSVIRERATELLQRLQELGDAL
jgi:hypothetical protein